MGDAGSAPPTGTVTFLFTDVEGSTRLWEELPDEMAAALERHDNILRSSIVAHGGYVFSTAGDAFSAAFTRTADALAAAVDAQRLLVSEPWPEGAVIRVRMGLHTGEAYERDGDYFGSTLNRAARIMSAGHGGQVLVSETTTRLLDTVPGIEFRAAGVLDLRGLSQPELVTQVVAEGLPVEFAALRSAASAGNLPAERDVFVGRQREIADLTELCRQHRLVTLTGAGGVGKTRLSIACGWRWSDEFSDGIWMINLAEVSSDDDVAVTAASTFGIRPQPGTTIIDSVADVVSSLRALVILDNCEHVLDGAAELAEAILDTPGRAVVLATSREGLGVTGERLVAIAPLGADNDSAEGVELFIDRATAAGWTPTDDLQAVRELCQRLDGMPLAIELAAARARSLPAAEMLSRLDDRFRLLTGARRRVERHQTLRATVAWSYDLLDPDQQHLFNRLSIFAGPFTLEDAEAVCADDRLDALDIANHLANLVDKSMVIGDGGRYRLLETLRQFGAEHLQADEIDQLESQFISRYTQLLTDIYHGQLRPDEEMWRERHVASWSNIKAAIDLAIANSDAEAAATMLAHIGSTVGLDENVDLALRWTAGADNLPGIEAARDYPVLLANASYAAIAKNDFGGASDYVERASQALDTDDSGLRYAVRSARSNLLSMMDQHDDAVALMQQVVDAAQEQGDPVEITEHATRLAFTLTFHGRNDEAADLVRPVIALADQSSGPSARAFARSVLGIALFRSNPAEAKTAFEGAIACSIRTDTYAYLASQARLAMLLATEGDHQRALQFGLESVLVSRRNGNNLVIWNHLMYLAFALNAVGEVDAVVRLLGGLSNSWLSSFPSAEMLLDRLSSQTRAACNDERQWNELFQQGAQLSAAQAVELAEQAVNRHLDTSTG